MISVLQANPAEATVCVRGLLFPAGERVRVGMTLVRAGVTGTHDSNDPTAATILALPQDDPTAKGPT